MSDKLRCEVTECYLMDLQEITLQAFPKMQLISDAQRESVLLQMQEWAKEFGRQYDADYEFDGDYYDLIDEFVDNKIYYTIADTFSWDEQAVTNLQYIMAYIYNDNGDMMDDWIHNFDFIRRLAIEFTTHERLNHINYDDPNQADFETTIVQWLKQHLSHRTA